MDQRNLLATQMLDLPYFWGQYRSMLSPSDLPFPPYEIATRTGSIENAVQFWSEWDEIGNAHRQIISSFIPADWSRPGRKTLDFGCGSGRTLRHFADEASNWQMWGCDLHAESIEWLSQNLDPPYHFFVVGDQPHIPQPDDYFDLIWAFSVFTHIADDWSGWLLELHRTLKPDGLALVSFLGKHMIGPVIGEEWDPNHIGMNCSRVSQSWDIGGPTVFHSEWWIRAHWGRAFEIVRLEDDQPGGHGFVLLRKRDIAVTRSELEAIDTDEPREISALQYNIVQLHAEESRLRQTLEAERAIRIDAETTKD